MVPGGESDLQNFHSNPTLAKSRGSQLTPDYVQQASKLRQLQLDDGFQLNFLNGHVLKKTRFVLAVTWTMVLRLHLLMVCVCMCACTICTFCLHTNTYKRDRSHNLVLGSSNCSVYLVVFTQPLSHAAARGKVLSYRVHVVSHDRSSRLVFPATESSSVIISDLAADAEYLLTIDARTPAGYNDSLHLQTVHIPKSADGLCFWISFL